MDDVVSITPDSVCWIRIISKPMVFGSSEAYSCKYELTCSFNWFHRLVTVLQCSYKCVVLSGHK